jgi:hypothetical protein
MFGITKVMALENSSKITPVYVPYATLLSSFDALKVNGIPASGIIDKSIWDTQSGTVQAQLILAYKFLGIINEQKVVAQGLPSIVNAEVEQRKAILKRIIEDKYQPVIAQGLTTTSPAQFEEAFRKFDINGSTLVRAIRFFVKACAELGIPINKRFVERAKPSLPRKKRAPQANSARGATEETPPVTPSPNAGWEEQLLAKFPPFDPSWPDPLKTKWFEGFERLMGAKPGQ